MNSIMDGYVIALVVIMMVLLSRKLPVYKYIVYGILALSMSPMLYFYPIKYYYKDHAANTAGAYIVYAAICSVILFDLLKTELRKAYLLFDILEYISLAAASCYVLFYGSKISFIVLLEFAVLVIPGVAKYTFLRNKYFYYVCSFGLILGAIPVFVLTKGSHNGLTYVYTSGGVIPFIIVVLSLFYCLHSMYETAINEKKIVILSGMAVCMTLLWLDSSMIRIPLVAFVFVLSYSMRLILPDSNADEVPVGIQSWNSNTYSKKSIVISATALSCEAVIALFILGPLEIFIGNRSELYFGLADFMPTMLAIALLVFTILLGLLCLIKRKWFKLVSYILFSIEACMYLQIMFMNIKLQESNGSNMDWGYIRWFMPLNLIIWICIIAIIFRLSITKIGDKIPLYGCIYLILVQVVAIASILPTAISESGRSNSVFSDENQYKLAKGENVVIFIIDALSRGDLDNTIEEYPELLDSWNDFTEYTNANSDYVNTYPSIIHMITSYEYDENDTDWRRNAWESDKSNRFFSKVHNEGYQFNMYTAETAQIGNYEELNGRVDNIITEIPDVDKELVTKLLVKASLYRSVFYYIKPKLEVFSHQYEEAIDFSSPCPFRNADYMQQLKARGITVAETMDNQISVIHLQGFHTPFCNDEKGGYLEGASRDQVIRGIVHILDEYLKKLKEIDRYDSTTIIITADHSLSPMIHPQPIFFVKTKNERHGDMEFSDAPIRHRDLQASLVEVIDSNDKSFGESIWDIKEGTSRLRTIEGQDSGFENRKYFKIEYNGDEASALDTMREIGMID